MAISYAHVIVRVSSEPAASMYIVVRVVLCTTAAPSRACTLMSEPYVYIHAPGVNFGVNNSGAGRVLPVGCPQWVVVALVWISPISLSSRSGCEKEYVDGTGLTGVA